MTKFIKDLAKHYINLSDVGFFGITEQKKDNSYMYCVYAKVNDLVSSTLKESSIIIQAFNSSGEAENYLDSILDEYTINISKASANKGPLDN